MLSDDTENFFESMVTSDQKQFQQHRQDQEGEQVQDEGHHSKSILDNSLEIFQRQEKITSIEERNEEEEEEERNEENGVVNRNLNSCCVDIDSYDESTQSSDVEEDLEEDVLRDRGWMSEVPRFPQTCEIGASNGIVLPTVEPPCFGDVCVKNSNNVHLGSKTFYKGPVTIKQFVYSNSEVKKDEESGDSEGKRDSVSSQNSISSNAPLKVHNEIDKVKQWLITRRYATIFCTIALMFVAIIVVIVLSSGRNNTALLPPIYPEAPGPDSSVDGEVWIHGVRLVTRDEWLAQPPSQPLSKNNLPVKYVFISHTVSDFCYTQSVCTKRVRLIQTYHIESNHWSDIAYSFLVGGDGLAYVGRGWDYEGAHTFNYNDKSIGISFIGTFNDFTPPQSQLHAAQKLIEEGVKLGKISKDYILLGHRQVSKTLSPGDALYGIIQKWPHWSPTP